MFFVAVLIAAAGGFGTLLIFEAQIANAQARSISALTQTQAARHELEIAVHAGDHQRDIQHHPLALALRDYPAQKRILFEVGKIAQGRNVRVAAIRLQSRRKGLAAEPTRLKADSYQLVLDGRYPRTILALADLEHASIVAKAERVSFERLRRNGSEMREVRATIDLDVFHLGGAAPR